MVREKKILCGRKYMDISIYNMPYCQKKNTKRNRRRSVSSPKQKNLNHKAAKRYFRQLVHTNFSERGYHLTLTYSDDNLPQSLEEAKRITDNYIRRLRNRNNKVNDNRPLKYIIVDEFSSKGRIHHHIIIDCGLHRDDIEKLWGLGYANCDRLQPDEQGLAKLCEYMQKGKEDRDAKEGRATRRWRASKNLQKPVQIINDNKYNNRRLNRIFCDFENKTMWRKLYPNWDIIEINIETNEYFGQSIYIKLRRRSD